MSMPCGTIEFRKAPEAVTEKKKERKEYLC
jgi:hypothetical protein